MMPVCQGLESIPKALCGAGSVSVQVLVFVKISHYHEVWSDSPFWFNKLPIISLYEIMDESGLLT